MSRSWKIYKLQKKLKWEELLVSTGIHHFYLTLFLYYSIAPVVWVSVMASGVESILLKHPCPELSAYVKQSEDKRKKLKREVYEKKKRSSIRKGMKRGNQWKKTARDIELSYWLRKGQGSTFFTFYLFSSSSCSHYLVTLIENSSVLVSAGNVFFLFSHLF